MRIIILSYLTQMPPMLESSRQRGAGGWLMPWQNRNDCADLAEMKIVWTRAHSAYATVIAVIGVGSVPGNLEGWRTLLSWVPGGAAVAEYGPALAIVAYLVCAFWAASVCMAAILSWLARVPWGFIILKRRIKGWLGMSEWLTREEAKGVIFSSDFWSLRTAGANIIESFANLTSALHLGQTRRQRIIERRFLERLILQFEQSVPDAVVDEKYNAALLQKWLDALVDKDVESEFGAIPQVFL